MKEGAGGKLTDPTWMAKMKGKQEEKKRSGENATKRRKTRRTHSYKMIDRKIHGNNQKKKRGVIKRKRFVKVIWVEEKKKMFGIGGHKED